MTLIIQDLQESLKQYTDQKLNSKNNNSNNSNNSNTNTINSINHSGPNNHLINNKHKKIINKKIIVESKTKEEIQNEKKSTINNTQNEIKKDEFTIDKEETKGGFFEIPTNKKREFDENEFDDSVEKLIVNTDDDHKDEKNFYENDLKGNNEKFNKIKTFNENTPDIKLTDMQGKFF